MRLIDLILGKQPLAPDVSSLYVGNPRPSTRSRTIGRFALPLMQGFGVKGVVIAPEDNDRLDLIIMIEAGAGVRVFVSEQEFVTFADYYFDKPNDVGVAEHRYSSKNTLFAATDVPGVVVVTQETTMR